MRQKSRKHGKRDSTIDNAKKVKKSKKQSKRTETCSSSAQTTTVQSETNAESNSYDIPIDLMSPSRAPMTREQWEASQSTVRRVLDQQTGRERLIKGDGEVVEEIVSRQRHNEINRKATQDDGKYFQDNMKCYIGK